MGTSGTNRAEVAVIGAGIVGLAHALAAAKQGHKVVLFERDHLSTFASIPRPEIAERWVGFYPRLEDGSSELVAHPDSGVTAVNGLGGAGMTLSFGLSEENLEHSELLAER